MVPLEFLVNLPRTQGSLGLYLLLTYFHYDRSGFPQGFGPMRRANPRSYDEYLKAYSMAMLPGRERENVSYGGKSTRHPT